MAQKTSIDINELWIGDWLRNNKSGVIGKYEGLTSNGRLILRTDQGLVHAFDHELELIDDPAESKPIDLYEEKVSDVKESVPASLDLHIEKLNPSYINALPERIRDIQVAAARKYVEAAIKRNLRIITIIHGKGTGVLKSEIMHLLGDYPEVQFAIPKKDGGAVEVWLKTF